MTIIRFFNITIIKIKIRKIIATKMKIICQFSEMDNTVFFQNFITKLFAIFHCSLFFVKV